MQVLVENIGKLERKLTVSLPADGMQNQINARLRQLGREVRIKGFRPGKVPARVIEQRFGNQVRSEALGEVIRNALNSALVQENLRPARAPAVEATKVDLDGELSFTATFEVMPDVGTVDVSALKVVRPVAEVKDEDIDHMIDTLRLQRRSWNEVARAAAVGDMVMFESNAVTAEGRVPPEGVERSGTIIGSGTVSNKLDGGPGKPVSEGGAGYSCIAEIRMIETINSGAAKTPFLRFGDTVRIEMLDATCHSIFGAIEQTVEQTVEQSA